MFHAARCLCRVPILRRFLALAVLFQVSERVSAEEPALESEPHVVVAVPMLSKIPYLNRLFKNVVVATNDGDQCERIGLDLGFSAGPGPFLTTLHCDPSAVAACHQCSEQATASKPSKSTDGECDSECCRHTCARSASAHGAGSSDLWSRLVEMAAERSAMESAVEIRRRTIKDWPRKYKCCPNGF